MREKAVTYLRVSGDAQIEGDGFPRQRDRINRWAVATGVETVAEFRDEGVSGKRELADRPGLAALLDRIESNGVGLVLIERADRLARDLVIAELLLRKFRDLGVHVIECEDGNDLTRGDQTNPTAKLIRQILGAVAEFDRDVTVLKLQAARDRKRRDTGRCEGRKPFGHYPGEAVAVDRIRQLRRKPRGKPRVSYAKIAAALQAEGYPTRTGKPWRADVVRQIEQRRRPGAAGRPDPVGAAPEFRLAR